MNKEEFEIASYDIPVERFLKNDNGVLIAPVGEYEITIDQHFNSRRLIYYFKSPLSLKDYRSMVLVLENMCKDQLIRLKGIIPKGSFYCVNYNGYYLSKTVILTHVWDNETNSFKELRDYKF